MPKINILLDELRTHTDLAAIHAPDVSQWSVGMHIEHCCLVTQGICRALIKSSPPTPPAKFSPSTAFVFLTGRIPRGRGRAPETVHPTEGVLPARLDELLANSAKWADEASRIEADAWFKHFVFGVLRRDKALRFIRIHNRHHLRIILDIARSVPSNTQPSHE